MVSILHLLPLLDLTSTSAVLGPAPVSHVCSVASLSRAVPSYATVLSAVHVPSGGSYGEGAADIAFPTNPTNLPDTCAVIVNVTTSDTSSFRFGLFLPTTTWNQRYLMVGNGGFSGGINWLDMGAGLQYGFAVASTDLGHNSSSFDISWALGATQKRLDFGFRATHGTTVIAKQMVEHFYTCNIRYSYYSGCSTGGRQGLKDAQLYPDDFDGMLIGAPAWWTAHLQTWTTKLGIYNLPKDAQNHIDPSLYPIIAAEVVAQCDAVDGVVDGIVSAPDLCNFNVDALLCTPTKTGNCLTAEQALTVNKIHADYVVNGKLAFPGLELSSEDQWGVLISGSEPASLGLQYIQYMLLDDPSWPWQNYTDSLVALADHLDPGACTADDYTAMARYQARGGKVLMYHGMSDGLISTGSSTHFYESVATALGGADKLSNWFRFFLIPGMQHCAGTAVDAPWYIAGGNQAGAVGTGVHSVPGFADPKHDAVMALMNWVEKGQAVNSLVATTWVDSLDPSSGVLRQRSICPYPSRPVYNGMGNVDAAESWACSE
ncbi:feruloyl esteras-like protein B [Ilyonectria destructans]|nr:feruloyl esteras-like protein B [Ilyonectria destructans]